LTWGLLIASPRQARRPPSWWPARCATSAASKQCYLMIGPQPREQRGGEHPCHQLQSDNAQQGSSLAACGTLVSMVRHVCVSLRCAAHQQHCMEGHHGKRADHDTLQGTYLAVPPEVNSAGHAHGGEYKHQKAQPRTMMPGRCQPDVHKAGSCGHQGTKPAVQDGTAGSVPSRYRRSARRCSGKSASGKSHRYRSRCGRMLRPAYSGWPVRPGRGCGRRSPRGGA
jgi:hypothetical protein